MKNLKRYRFKFEEESSCNCDIVPDSNGLYVKFDDIKEVLKTSRNSAMLKFPTIEECYKGIPFPSNERECAMFVAGIAECHKFVGRKLQQ